MFLQNFFQIDFNGRYPTTSHILFKRNLSSLWYHSLVYNLQLHSIEIWSLFYCKCFCKQPSRVLHHVLFWVHLLSCFRYSYVILNHEMKHRSSRVELFCRLDVLKRFAKFVGKHLSRSFFWIKFQAWRPITLFKIDSSAGVFLWILYKV